MKNNVTNLRSISSTPRKIAIVGGCGHVGLPLGITFALHGCDVTLIDVDQATVDSVNAGHFPFMENGGNEALKKVIGKNLIAVVGPESIRESSDVIFVMGTPVDEHLNPIVHDVLKIVDEYLPYLSDGQLIILRSTLFPGLTEVVANHIRTRGKNVGIAFCPERVAQGFAIEEIQHLPQIVSAIDETSENRAADLFRIVTKEIIRTTPLEAELVKLFANSWRYIEFAIANQHYMIAEAAGVSFQRVHFALTHHYPRAQSFAAPGLTAGPCLFKDTMQLSAYCNHNYSLGNAAMLINEGLPNFLVQQLETKLDGLQNKKIGLLGMSFKPNHDDTRESLSYKLKKVLEIKMANVMCTDVYQESAADLSTILNSADAFILGTPHKEYASLDLGGKPFVDCWGMWSRAKLEGEALIVEEIVAKVRRAA